jgi:hypothetical protein
VFYFPLHGGNLAETADGCFWPTQIINKYASLSLQFLQPSRNRGFYCLFSRHWCIRFA